MSCESVFYTNCPWLSNSLINNPSMCRRRICIYFAYCSSCFILSLVFFNLMYSYITLYHKLEHIELNLGSSIDTSDQTGDFLATHLAKNNALQQDFSKTVAIILNITCELQAFVDTLSEKSKVYNVDFQNLINRIETVFRNFKSECQLFSLEAARKALTNTVTRIPERIDYAAESIGGEIVSIGKTVLITKYFIGTIFGYSWVENPPRMVIQQSLVPGECFGFKGHEGSITIKLMGRVYIDTIVIGHISPSQSPTGNINSAPKDFSAWGLEDPGDESAVYFGNFAYDILKAEQFQVFQIDCKKSYQFVRIIFFTNHGHPNHTCVYRVRVHGVLDQ